jgi:magnesium chelatase accessory protein
MATHRDRLSWTSDGADWPNRAHSSMVAAGGLSWHLQRMGNGPRLLLLHGTGASTHSFRDLAPELARNFDVLAPDLPGHAFTAMPDNAGLSLPGMSRLLRALISQRTFEPDIAVGHSAGAAILIEMALAGLIRPRAIVSINGALLPIRGASLFSPLAKVLFVNPLVPRLFAWRALSHEATRRVIEGTGSTIDRRGLELYQRLFRNAGHVAGALGMMANWDLDQLQRGIARLSVPLVLVRAAKDTAVPPSDVDRIARQTKSARVVALPDGGHLVHEERPGLLADIIADAAREVGLLPKQSVCQI